MKRDLLENAWHHVRGISTDEMKLAAEEAQRLYGDIMLLPRPESKKHPPLSMEQKAAQFSPFAALSGYGDAIDETGRLTDRRAELDEQKKEELDEALQQLQQMLLDQSASGAGTAKCSGKDQVPAVSVTWFDPDLRKEGGSYRVTMGQVKKIDPFRRELQLTDGTQIGLDAIDEIEIL